MKRRTERHLKAEDRILWRQVARTVTPLDASRFDPDEIDVPVSEDTPPETVVRRKPQSLPSPQQQPPQPVLRSYRPPGIDEKTRGRISKGRIRIDARIDLHGLTQAQAHGLLLSFLHDAHSRSMRHVLVITGKGSSPASEGVLRRAVPAWLATAPFLGLVSGHSPASRRHGGDGALYIRLRRGEADGAGHLR